MNAPLLRPPMADATRIAAALEALFEPDDIIELRALFSKRRKRTDAGYFDGAHRELLIKEAVRLNNQGAAVYLTMNRLDWQLLSRYANRIQQGASATATDANITRRCWLLLDFDPNRTKDTSATDAQLEAAKAVSRTCFSYLKAEGWPAPLVAESGNGMHLLYPLDLPNGNESRDLIKGALAGMARRFDTDAVTVDQAVFNAGRIIKLYGTVANKGDHTPAAPWRLSRLVSTPPRDRVATAEQLRTLQPAAEEPYINGTSSHHHAAPFDLEEFLSRLGIGYTHDVHEGSDRYKLDHCPFNADHGRGEAAIFRSAGGVLGFKCQHNSCAHKHRRDVRELEDGPREARTRSTTNEHSETTSEPETNGHSATSGAAEGRMRYRRASEIEMLPIRWLWPKRIARDTVSIVAGHPGLGKSQLTASLSAIVSTGGLYPVDRTQCEVGNVVILSAEDGAERVLVPRLNAAGADLSRVIILHGTIASGKAEASERIINLKADLGELQRTLAGIGDVTLVVIDPITAYLGDTDSHKNADIRALLAPLSGLAEKHGAALVCVSHLTKRGGTEAMMRVTGSLAFVAAARAAFLVAKDKDDDMRRLFLPLKVNYGDDRTGLAFKVQSTQLTSPAGQIETSHVMWEAEAVTVTADQAINPQDNGVEYGALSEAVNFLECILQRGAVSSKQIKAEADEAGYAWRTIRRAKDKLGIIPTKTRFDDNWEWALPSKVARMAQGVQQNNLDTWENLDILGRSRPKMTPKCSRWTHERGRYHCLGGCVWCQALSIRQSHYRQTGERSHQ